MNADNQTFKTHTKSLRVMTRFSLNIASCPKYVINHMSVGSRHF